jgi:hypothetical protein
MPQLPNKATRMSTTDEPEDIPAELVELENNPLGIAPEPWERQPEETPNQFRMFVVYRDLGLTRTYTKTAEQINKNISYISKIARQNNWRERAQAWDDYEDRMRRLGHIESIRKMTDMHQKVGGLMLQKALQRLQTMQPSELDSSDVRQMIVEGARMQRQSLGQPETHTQIDLGLADPDQSRFASAAATSPEVVEALRRALTDPADESPEDAE